MSEGTKTLLKMTTFNGEIKIQIDPKRLRPIDADLQVPNTTKFFKHTGWKPLIPYEKTMLDLLNFWREKVKVEDFLDR
jgi:GDPmannose 4,6-dehydratase